MYKTISYVFLCIPYILFSSWVLWLTPITTTLGERSRSMYNLKPAKTKTAKRRRTVFLLVLIRNCKFSMESKFKVFSVFPHIMTATIVKQEQEPKRQSSSSKMDLLNFNFCFLEELALYYHVHVGLCHNELYHNSDLIRSSWRQDIGSFWMIASCAWMYHCKMFFLNS